MDVILTKWIAISGAVKIAEAKEQELRAFFSNKFVDNVFSYKEFISCEEDICIAKELNAVKTMPVGKFGIYGALWEFGKALNCGLDIELRDIPVKQEIIELSEFVDVDPYMLESFGSVLIAAENGNAIITALKNAGIKATYIGCTTKSNDRLILDGEHKRFIEPGRQDELDRIFKK